MNNWHRWHKGRWWTRWPLKVGMLVIWVGFVLYPKLWLLPTWIGRLRDLNSTLQPDLPGLAVLEEMARAVTAPGAGGPETLRAVEGVVYREIPYAWDWDVWGVVDYVPTTAEVLRNGRGDCEARAVVAASLLRRLGFDAWLVTDLKHMWVATPAGETMGPGVGEKTFTGGADGTRVTLSPGVLSNLGRSVSYGVAVFPLVRELLIVAALCALTMHPRSSVVRRVLGCLLLLLALGLLRASGAAGWELAERPWLVWVGWVVAVAGWLTLAVKAAGRRSRSEPPGLSAEDAGCPG